MKTPFILLVAAALCSSGMKGQGWQWARSAGGTANDFCGVTDYNSSTITADKLGNTYVTGLFTGAATFGTVSISSPFFNTHVFVAKYDPSGTCLWAKQFGGDAAGAYENEGKSVDIDGAGDCYVAGVFHGSAGSTIIFGSSTLTCTGQREIFIARYDANGNEQWARQPVSAAGSNNYAKSIATDAAGNSYITGYLGGGNINFGNTTLSGAGAFAVKYDASGIVQWACKVGTNNMADGLCIDADESGNSYVSGYFGGTESFATTPATQFTATGNGDVFLAKIDPTGTLSWVKQLPCVVSNNNNIPTTMSYAKGKGVSVDGTGNVLLTGDFNSGLVVGATTLTSQTGPLSAQDAFAAKFDSNGNPVWGLQTTTSGQGGASTYGTSVKANPTGNCFITGYYYPFSTESFGTILFPTGFEAGNQIVYVIKIDSTGVPAWGQFSSGQGSSAMSSGISLDATGDIYVSGNIQINANFGASMLTSISNFSDIFVAKLLGSGTVTGTTTVPTGIQTQQAGENSLAIYPNPFSTLATVDAKAYSGNGAVYLKIYNLLGQEVKSIANISSSAVLDRGSLANGIYTYQFSNKGAVLKTGKLVVE